MYYRLILLSCFILLFGCNRVKKAGSTVMDTAVKAIDTVAKAPVKTILLPIEEVKPFKQFPAFWVYYTKRIKLNENFVAYDKGHKEISKATFLKDLSTGKYQPIRINPADTIRYQLKPAPAGAEGIIASYMKMFSKTEQVFYHMEGKPVPHFDFNTLDGSHYTSENTRGKIVLFKCWFIGCVACVAEMPELNELRSKYRNRKDIVFLSLAMDEAAPLENFLKKTRFDYQTVAEQTSYMADQLKVAAYPSHFLIDKEGKLVKVSNTAEEINMFLERLLAKGQ